MVYYLVYFGLLIFWIFALSYRMDELFTAKAHIFKRIKLNKTISKHFFYQDKRKGILRIALIFQILGYLLIPISIVLTCIFVLKGYTGNFGFNRSFGKAIFSALPVLGAVMITLMIIDRRSK